MKEYGLRANIYERWLFRYNSKSRYPCRIKSCSNKLRNGRCGLDMCRLESRDDNSLTGVCLDFTTTIGGDCGLARRTT